MKKGKRLFRSFYVKLIAMFLGVGLLPLIAMGLVIYNTYSGTLYSNVLSNYSQMTELLADSISGFMEEISDTTEHIYRLDVMEYDYFYELFEDEELPETVRQTMVTNVLRTILYMNDYIEHVIFVAEDGRQYFCMRPPEHLMSSEVLEQWHEDHFVPGSRAVALIPTHDAEYFLNSERMSLTVYRNIMNTSTIQKAGSEVLGTLYIDVRSEYVENLIEQAQYGSGHTVYMADLATGKYIYHPEGAYEQSNALEDGMIPQEIREMENGCQKAGKEYFIFSRIGESGWILIDRIDSSVIDGSYRMIRNNTFLLIFAAAALLLLIYVASSRRLERPVRELKKAMGRIETGDLDVRVDITSNDEMEDIGKGLNQMVENLSDYIQKAYVAEIRQRDAEMEALISQIQPHYLYNTLDVIRMSAITNDDVVVADMINSLSAQLKYLIGARGKMVRLEEEIACIRNYFRLIEVRYEYLYSLQIDIDPALMEYRVPHLIIQPVVENAVKHGLRPKKESGEVVVGARKNDRFLELAVMDNGVGMTKERLTEIKMRIAGGDAQQRSAVSGMSIGIRNVSDRIRLLYGELYGLEIESYEGIGTIVKYWLPLIGQEEGSVQKE